ncbi:MAG: transposase [bacterium]
MTSKRTEHTMGRPGKDDRLMLNGILWILGTGAPWRDLPECYGPWQTVYKRFAKWQKEGIYEAILEELSKDADLQDISMDGTYIKAHKDSAGARREGTSYPKC